MCIWPSLHLYVCVTHSTQSHTQHNFDLSAICSALKIYSVYIFNALYIKKTWTTGAKLFLAKAALITSTFKKTDTRNQLRGGSRRSKRKRMMIKSKVRWNEMMRMRRRHEGGLEKRSKMDWTTWQRTDRAVKKRFTRRLPLSLPIDYTHARTHARSRTQTRT